MAAASMLSRTVRVVNPTGVWNVRMSPISATRQGAKPSMRWPPKVIAPWSGGSNPVMALNRVVLPAPLGPIRAVTWSWGITADTSSTATTPPKVLRTLSSTSSMRSP